MRFLFNIIRNMSNSVAKAPIVVVLGATGAGKSKLALEIAEKFNGEVISADSMQIYKGLDIVTNKVTQEECGNIPHHMLGFLNPLDNYNVVDFRNDVIPLVDDIHQRGKVPVVVGGTHYYVESILWNVLIQPVKRDKRKCSASSESISDSGTKSVEKLSIGDICKMCIDNKSCDIENSDISLLSDKCPSDNRVQSDSEGSGHCDNRDSECLASRGLDYLPNQLKLDQDVKLEDLSNSDLLNILEMIDPESASIYHPNNRRKIMRSIEVWVQTGVRHSEHLRLQAIEGGVADLGGVVRFERVAILWIRCDPDVLDKRLDKRVDDMMENGLLDELEQFHKSVNVQKLEELKDSNGVITENQLLDHYRKGVFQCIGFKEFHDYLEAPGSSPDSGRNERKLREAIEKMKLRTRQYSRRQVKWIRNRLLLRDRQRIPVYGFDGSDLTRWDEDVSRKAEYVVRDILEGRSPGQAPMAGDVSTEKKLTGDKTKYECKVCNRIIIGDLQYNVHLKSVKHHKMLKRLQRMAASTPEENKNSEEV